MGPRIRLAAVCAAVAAAMVSAAPAAQAQRPVVFGLNDALLTHAEGTDRVLDLHRSLGATVQRAAVQWRMVQPQPGTWDWAYVDRLIGRAADRGVGTIALVMSPPPWASTSGYHSACFLKQTAPGCQRAPAPAHLGDLQVFLQALAERYPALVAIEVFNEPNLGTWFWQPQADPEYYAQVLRAAHDAVERVRPGLPVLSGGVSEPPHPVPAGSMRAGEFLERMYRAGARGAMDGIAVHPYPANTSPSEPARSGYHRLMAEVREIRDRHGDGERPLWITETGYTSTGPFAVSPDEQARWLPAIVDDAFSQPDVAAVVVHTLRDRPGGHRDDPETGFGLLYADLSPKPAFDALARTVNAVKQRRAAERRRSARRRSSARSRRCQRSSRRGERSENRSTRARQRARSRRCRCRKGRRCAGRGKQRAGSDRAVRR